MTAEAARKPGDGEFIALMALMTSLVALSIDAMLPALAAIGQDLGVTDSNDNQLIVTVLFFGLFFGQLIYGPLSDSIGRKPAIYVGLVLFVGGCLLSISAESFAFMLFGRFLQGLGAAGPRIVTIALVRDQYEGRLMARIMSFVMGVFILVPALAPALGQLVLALSHWRAIFVCFLVLALLMWIWFGLRQCETLPPDKRHAFSLARIGRAMHETCTHRIALGYMLAAGFVFGGLVAYLVLAQQILQIQYELGAAFPLYFGVLALAIGAASYLNGRLVVRYGMKHLSEQALWVMSASSFGFIVVALQTLGHPPLWLLMAYLLLVFFCLGFVFGNFNALAMQPLGHIAGSAAAAIGAVTTVMSMVLGGIVGQAYDGSVVPLVGAFAVYGSAALLASRWAEGSG